MSSKLRPAITYAILTLGIGACATAPPKPVEDSYEANFAYAVPATTDKIDVTVGIVAPSFTGDGLNYQTTNQGDDTVRAMLSGVRSSFTALLVAKGFNAAGPFDNLDQMTFPEKKGSDFILYPEFDISGGYVIKNRRAEADDSILAKLTRDDKKTKKNEIIRCTIVVQPKGTVSIVAREPLSKEKMWIKKIDLAVDAKTFDAEGSSCDRSGERSRAMQNAWARAHETIFKSVMTSLDKYVNADEFKTLKRQSAELRERKTY